MFNAMLAVKRNETQKLYASEIKPGTDASIYMILVTWNSWKQDKLLGDREWCGGDCLKGRRNFGGWLALLYKMMAMVVAESKHLLNCTFWKGVTVMCVNFSQS